MNAVIYTAVCGDVDVLRYRGRKPGRYVAFMDKAPMPWKPLPQSYLGWEIRPAEPRGGSPRMRAKRHQVMPHLDFPDVEYSLYLDGTHVPAYAFDLERLIRVYLRHADMATFVNPQRDCIYDEAEVCIKNGVGGTPEMVRGQVEWYREQGCPEHVGLPGITCLLRRHTPEIEMFNKRWYEEVKARSTRDQISFAYLAWKMGIPWAKIPGHCYYNDLFHYVPHGWLWSEGGVKDNPAFIAKQMEEDAEDASRQVDPA